MGTSIAPSPYPTQMQSEGWTARLLGRVSALEPAQVVVLLTVIGAALRFGTLNVQSIWLDESATILLVHRGFSGMLSHLSSSESTPPLYYILVWAWTKVFGLGPIGFRSFSAMAGTLTIPVMYAAGKQISPRVGIWAAALTAVNPAMYYYSQEARCYALLILFSAASYVLWQCALQMPDGRRLAYWAGMSILAVLTHYFAAFIFLPEAVVLVRRLGWRVVWAPIGAVVLAGIALLPLAISQRADGKASWIEEASLISRIGATAKQLLIGIYPPLEILTALLAGLLVIATIVLLLRRAERDERAGARDAAIVAIVGVALPLGLALTHVLDVFDGRNVIAAWVPFAVFLAVALGVRRAPRAGALLGAGFCALSIAMIVGINAIPAYQRDDWRGVAHALPAAGSARVIVAEQFASLPLSVYLGPLTALPGASFATRELDFVGLRTRRTGRSPAPPVVPTRPPAGFRLAEVHRTEAFAVSRFVAPSAVLVRASAVRRLIGEPKAEIVVHR